MAFHSNAARLALVSAGAGGAVCAAQMDAIFRPTAPAPAPAGRSLAVESGAGAQQQSLASLPAVVSCAAASEKAAPAGDVFAWGAGQFGQLGLASEADVAVPTVVKGMNGELGTQLAAGAQTSAVITTGGEVLTWGAGGDNRLGHGAETFEEADVLTPRLADVVDADDDPYDVIALAAGAYHMAVIGSRADGGGKPQVLTWGRHRNGQLGHDVMIGEGKRRKKQATGLATDKDEGFFDRRKNNATRQAVRGGGRSRNGTTACVEGVAGTPVAVACGERHTACVTADGELYTWGSGFEGQLGHGSKGDEDRPRRVDPDSLAGESVTGVACGRDFTLVVTAEGSLFAFGADEFGQLGLGRGERYVREPKRVRALRRRKVSAVAAGSAHAVVVLDNGTVYSWGAGREGQTGHGGTEDISVPKPIASMGGRVVEHVACGGAHTAVIADGELLMCGRGRSGQLGLGEELTSVAARATELRRVPLEGRALSVACGGDHTLALVRA